MGIYDCEKPIVHVAETYFTLAVLLKFCVSVESNMQTPTKYCTYCGEQIAAQAEICPKCGVRQAPSMAYSQQPSKDKLTAALLALFLGGLGIHHFYLGNQTTGVLYLVFCWTFIPAILGLIDGIRYLTMSDGEWASMTAGLTYAGTPYAQTEQQGFIAGPSYASKKSGSNIVLPVVIGAVVLFCLCTVCAAISSAG